MDKRFERSEKLIRQAFFELLAVKSSDDISVSEICRQAECSRNTFYLHYDSKNHLLTAILDEVIEDIEHSCRPVVSHFSQIGLKESRRFTDQILEVIKKHETTIKGLLAQEQWQFSQRLSTVILESHIREAKQLKQPYHQAQLVYFTSGMVGFIQYWLTTDWPLEKAQEE